MESKKLHLSSRPAWEKIDGHSLRGRIVQLKLVTPVEGGLDTWISPKPLYGVYQLRREDVAFDRGGSVHHHCISVLVAWADGDLHQTDTFKQHSACQLDQMTVRFPCSPHRLNRVGVDNLTVAITFFGVIRSVRISLISPNCQGQKRRPLTCCRSIASASTRSTFRSLPLPTTTS